MSHRLLFRPIRLRPPNFKRHFGNPALFSPLQSRKINPMSTQENVTKKAKIAKMIGTHNGTFHCDEALAVFLLRKTSTFANANVTRTRDPALLSTCDIVVDVGATYDPFRLLFDHHQRGFEEVFGSGFNTKLSSAGLIYKHYGKEIIAGELQLPLVDPKVELLWLKLYEEFIEGIDGIDNGVLQYPEEVVPKYRIRTDVSARVGWLNPAWNQSVEPSLVDARFENASTLVGEEFLGRLMYYGQAWLPARDLIVQALEARFSVDPSGKIVLFESFAPWKEHLFELEKQLSITESEQPVYIVYPDETGGNWRVQAVPISPDSFLSRKPLPEAWRGVRDDALSQLSGIPGCIFVHASGFIGGNHTEAGAMEMAKRGLVMD